jgi:hypothetical protein
MRAFAAVTDGPTLVGDRGFYLGEARFDPEISPGVRVATGCTSGCRERLAKAQLHGYGGGHEGNSDGHEGLVGEQRSYTLLLPIDYAKHKLVPCASGLGAREVIAAPQDGEQRLGRSGQDRDEILVGDGGEPGAKGVLKLVDDLV